MIHRFASESRKIRHPRRLGGYLPSEIGSIVQIPAYAVDRKKVRYNAMRETFVAVFFSNALFFPAF
jgi:hypothetical protein